ncbi:TIGR04222 domain-containing membrane protein [Streptomyces lichenis]|uniref:TIGR04222 domain-containing membrane protein n=1 Tax=Streptomyces lichenis TaxID=2306967 RepID=A0ABT0IIA8_9ACTN|nr:TIGR04222 domain-containing membrane protein [Streptomyces lichenis]MCK8681070.1 TIGR04222 domain-containing membrane protein [Streptomyces lichenis]
MLWVPLLLVTWVAAALSCVRLCLTAVAATDHHRPGPGDTGPAAELTLHEAAFLAGGPQRVAELTLVSMHRRQRVLLAHTGWATVVRPDGGDEWERSVLGAIGPEGQSPIAAVRAGASADQPVRSLADRLVGSGLAVAADTRAAVLGALRAVRASTALTVALAAAAVLLLPEAHTPAAPELAWFGLPLVLTTGCLVIARFECRPYTGWASPAGQRLLRRLSPRDPLSAVAVGGVGTLDDPALRAALTTPHPRALGIR